LSSLTERLLPAVTVAGVILGAAALLHGLQALPLFVETTVAAQQTPARVDAVDAGEAASRTQCITCHKVAPPGTMTTTGTSTS
jgi:mono/diheme cytochrome c family protein